MGGYRAARIAEMIHRELAERLRLEVKDPRMEPISITHVAVTKDLSRATVEYLPLGGDEPSKDLKDALKEAAKVVRGPIGRALRLRHAPEIVFSVDTHTAEAFRVSRLIEEVAADRAQHSGDDEEEAP